MPANRSAPLHILAMAVGKLFMVVDSTLVTGIIKQVIQAIIKYVVFAQDIPTDIQVVIADSPVNFTSCY